MKADHETFIRQCVEGVVEEPSEAPVRQRITGTAQAILRSMDEFWEDRLFAQVLRDELAKHTDVARDLRYGIPRQTRKVDPAGLASFASDALSQVHGFLQAILRLSDEPFKDAMGPSQVRGDPAAICYIATRIAEVYRSILEWGISWYGVYCDWSTSRRFIELMPEYLKNLVSAIERLPADIEESVRKARDLHADPSATLRVEFLVQVPEALFREIELEIDRMTGKRQPWVSRVLFVCVVAVLAVAWLFDN
jgi:hypothetical protein